LKIIIEKFLTFIYILHLENPVLTELSIMCVCAKGGERGQKCKVQWFLNIKGCKKRFPHFSQQSQWLIFQGSVPWYKSQLVNRLLVSLQNKKMQNIPSHKKHPVYIYTFDGWYSISLYLWDMIEIIAHCNLCFAEFIVLLL